MSSDHNHAHGHAEGEAHGSLKDYVIGFVLSVILTVIPFWLVMNHPLSNGVTTAIILGFAAVQMIVHIIFFLHMNGKVEGGWSLTSTVFTLIVIVIMMSGSIWVMYHLNANMMPVHDVSQLP